MALAGMSAAGKAVNNEERKRIVETIMNESLPVLRSYANGARVAFELSANLATAIA